MTRVISAFEHDEAGRAEESATLREIVVRWDDEVGLVRFLSTFLP